MIFIKRNKEKKLKKVKSDYRQFNKEKIRKLTDNFYEMTSHTSRTRWTVEICPFHLNIILLYFSYYNNIMKKTGGNCLVCDEAEAYIWGFVLFRAKQAQWAGLGWAGTGRWTRLPPTRFTIIHLNISCLQL